MRQSKGHGLSLLVCRGSPVALLYLIYLVPLIHFVPSLAGAQEVSDPLASDNKCDSPQTCQVGLHRLMSEMLERASRKGALPAKSEDPDTGEIHWELPTNPQAFQNASRALSQAVVDSPGGSFRPWKKYEGGNNTFFMEVLNAWKVMSSPEWFECMHPTIEGICWKLTWHGPKFYKFTSHWLPLQQVEISDQPFRSRYLPKLVMTVMKTILNSGLSPRALEPTFENLAVAGAAQRVNDLNNRYFNFGLPGLGDAVTGVENAATLAAAIGGFGGGSLSAQRDEARNVLKSRISPEMRMRNPETVRGQVVREYAVMSTLYNINPLQGFSYGQGSVRGLWVQHYHPPGLWTSYSPFGWLQSRFSFFSYFGIGGGYRREMNEVYGDQILGMGGFAFLCTAAVNMVEGLGKTPADLLNSDDPKMKAFSLKVQQLQKSNKLPAACLKHNHGPILPLTTPTKTIYPGVAAVMKAATGVLAANAYDLGVSYKMKVTVPFVQKFMGSSSSKFRDKWQAATGDLATVTKKKCSFWDRTPLEYESQNVDANKNKGTDDSGIDTIIHWVYSRGCQGGRVLIMSPFSIPPIPGPILPVPPPLTALMPLWKVGIPGVGYSSSKTQFKD